MNKNLLLRVLADLAGEDATSKLVLKKYDKYANRVGEAFLARPDFEASYVSSWKSLASHIGKMYKQTLTRIGVEYVPDDPYKDFDEMKKSVEESGVLKVYQGESDHPVWTEEENWVFRAVHDAMIHLAGKGHPFTLRGELAAYNRHYKMAPTAARHALFTEVVGQTCTYFHLGESFNFPQKVTRLWGFDYNNVGEINEQEFKKNFSEVGKEKELAASLVNT